MASALEKMLKGTLQKTESQKAFSPWWSDFEDKLLYSVMILGACVRACVVLNPHLHAVHCIPPLQYLPHFRRPVQLGSASDTLIVPYAEGAGKDGSQFR